MLSLGIDHDANHWKVAVWDEQAVADLRALRAAADVWEVVDELLTRHPATPIVLPSGLGVPLTRAADLMDQDIAEITLGHLDHGGQVTGDLGPFLMEARRRALRAFCIPAVKLLPSVPIHRKINRLDLGSAGALCAAAWIIHATSAGASEPASGDWLLVHAARAGTCLLAIRASRIIDGTGILAPALGRLSARKLDELRRCTARLGPSRAHAQTPWPSDALVEAEGETLTQVVLGWLRFHGLPRAVVIGERGAEAERLLGGRAPLAAPPAEGAGFEAALGAAVLAAGLTGGPTAGLVQQLGLREVRERPLDWLAPLPLR
jgi:predicted butyrate kinase (DUF1464 family)